MWWRTSTISIWRVRVTSITNFAGLAQTTSLDEASSWAAPRKPAVLSPSAVVLDLSIPLSWPPSTPRRVVSLRAPSFIRSSAIPTPTRVGATVCTLLHAGRPTTQPPSRPCKLDVADFMGFISHYRIPSVIPDLQISTSRVCALPHRRKLQCFTFSERPRTVIGWNCCCE